MKEANREVLDRGSLAELLTHRARQASDLRLVIDAAAGFVVAVVIAILRPPLWLPLAALAFALGAFGAWGILDRESFDPASVTGRRRVIVASRAIVGALGALAALLGGVSLFFGLLGTWIS
jgi:hypothetical protein